jgi:D-glycero-D-manno-heptose 1,7-bisphosphate phosphatase
MNYKLIVFDVDGTLIRPMSGGEFRKSADDWELLPGRAEKLKALKEVGVRLAIASNQGGVAFGYLRQIDILRELQNTARSLGIPEGGGYICYTHPRASIAGYRFEDHRRKPGPGMLQDAMRDFEADAGETLMVGDRPEDEGAAINAGVAFMWAKDFFGDPAS